MKYLYLYNKYFFQFKDFDYEFYIEYFSNIIQIKKGKNWRNL